MRVLMRIFCSYRTMSSSTAQLTDEASLRSDSGGDQGRLCEDGGDIPGASSECPCMVELGRSGSFFPYARKSIVPLKRVPHSQSQVTDLIPFHQDPVRVCWISPY